MARTCTTSFLYLVLVLLPQMLWLHHSNHGLVVCEACGSVMEAALNNRAKAPPPSHVSDQCTSELPCSDDAAYQELSEEESDYTRMNDTHYPSLCSCSVAGAEGKVSDVYSDAPNGGWWVLITLVCIDIPVTIGALLVATLISLAPVP